MYYLPVTLILFSIFRYNNTNRGEWKNLSALLFFFSNTFCIVFVFCLSFLTSAFFIDQTECPVVRFYLSILNRIFLLQFCWVELDFECL